MEGTARARGVTAVVLRLIMNVTNCMYMSWKVNGGPGELTCQKRVLGSIRGKPCSGSWVACPSDLG